jgi:hypothetical protein
MWTEYGNTLFVLAGGALTLRNAAIVRCQIQYLARHGALTFSSVVTDLSENPAVLSASFAAVDCHFGQAGVKTVKLKGFRETVCPLTEPPVVPTPTALSLTFPFASHGNGGIRTFLVIAGISGALLFVYYALVKIPREYEKLGEMDALPFEK